MNRNDFENKSFEELVEQLFDEGLLTTYEAMKERAVEAVKNDDLTLALHILEALDRYTTDYYAYDYAMGQLQEPSSVCCKEDVECYVEEEHKHVMTREQQIQLCTIYNNSDIECFKYLAQFCNSEQLDLLHRLIALNWETDIGWGERDATLDEVDEYTNGKRKLLNDFGIDVIEGDAYFEGTFYQ